MSDFHVSVGDEVSFSKTVGESDIYGFAGITGDLSPNHVNDQYMKESSYGQRIAHGALMVGFMSTASTLMIKQSSQDERAETPVSAGYDRIRFTGAVYINDTVTVTYRIASIELDRRRSRSAITVTNQSGETVAVGEHIMQWVPNG
ncbi:MAG: MaoC/PaaZ C-terminal domain-containing protein [Arenicellales bacterium]|jgi:acyl dehydratase|nr:MaoC/PaaZ C-terminal domain-containing protein [Arenicellales bacterium]|tara:strand:- start:285 stop:722 length:438 start_codon:yes stop_codon:yes gene_type:complete